MTWKIRVENPDMDHPNRILHGELAALVGDIFRKQGISYDKLTVEWEDPEKPQADPFLGQRQAMVAYGHQWLMENAGSPGDAIPSFPMIAKAIREEWVENRGFDGIDGNFYLDLAKFVDVAKQVRKGWVQ